MTNPQIDAYAAGLFDGEGNIGAGQTRGAWTIACHTGMTVKAVAVLRGLCAEYGGRVRLHREATDKWAEAWTWSLHGTEAAEFLRRVLPYLRLKREIAETALRLEQVRAELETFAPGSKRKRWTPEATERCAALHREIKRQNRRGPETEPKPGFLALLVDGSWMSPQADLFTDTGWAPFLGRFPASGMTQGGALYELPTPVPPTDGHGSSSLLPTLVADHSRGLPQSGTDYASLPNVAISLLPTPRATDGTKGGPNQRGSSGDLMLPSAVVQLLPTPVVNDMGEGKTVDHWDQWTETMRAKHGNGNGHGPSLAIEAQRLLPTPEASDATGGRVSAEMGGTRASGAKRAITLATAISHGVSTSPRSDGGST